MNTPLQNNSLANLHRTLDDLTGRERQIKYKAAVPFVQVPIELLEQWADSIGLLRPTTWFRSVFSQTQEEAMERFDARVGDVRNKLGSPCPDVPEILDNAAWQSLMEAARELRSVVPRPEPSEEH